MHASSRCKRRDLRDVRFYVDKEGMVQNIVISGDYEHVCNVIFVDWNSVYEYGIPEEVYSEMVRLGGEKAKEAAIKALRAHYEKLRDIVPLNVYGRWVLHLVFEDKAIPYYVVGDGIRYALMFIMRALTPKESVLLLEEPELHTHPSLMKISVNAILRSCLECGNQVFLSTHSLELIKAILEEARKLGFKDEELKVFRFVLDDDKLYSEEYTMDEAWTALEEIEWDLRG